MKKGKKILCILVVGIAICLWMVTTNSYAVSKGTITGQTVKLREEPSLEGKLVTLLSVGNKVEVLGKEGQWYEIDYDGKKGYVFGDYIEVEGQEPVKEEAEEPKQEEVKPEEENNQESQTEETSKQEEKTYPQEVKVKEDTKIYLLPVINADTIKQTETEEKVTATEEKNDWVYIAGENFTGWIRKSAIMEEEPNKEAEEPKQEEKKEENKKIGYINAGTVNLRKEPSTDSPILASLAQNTEVTILGEKDNWYQVSINGKTGYIAVAYISDKKVTTSRSATTRTEKQSKTMYVSVSTANMRQKASTSSKLLGKVYRKDAVTVVGEEGDFYQVIVSGQEAYISKELLVASLDEIKKETTATNSNSSNNASTSENTTSNESSQTKASDLIAYAKTLLGKSYKYGASGPNAFDCSGFTSYVYRHFGYALSRSSSGQSRNGRAVSKAELQPGDLVFFGSSSNINHVGIYIGNNQFIHAENPEKGVTITSLSASYYSSKYVTARRIL